MTKFSTIFLCLLSYTIISQAYRAMAVEGATWVYEGWGDFNGYSETYFIKGDTIIGNTKYKNVFLNSSWYGYMRDDTITKKVYTSPSLISIFEECNLDSLHLEQEILFCDFNYSIGDTIKTCLWEENSDYYEIKFEDRRNLFYEEFRVLSFEDTIEYNSQINLIEGIGSLDGFLGSLSSIITSGGGINLSTYCITAQLMLTKYHLPSIYIYFPTRLMDHYL